MQVTKQRTDEWPGGTVPVQLTFAGLDATYEGNIDLGAIETFADPWRVEVPDAEMGRLLADLAAQGASAERVAQFGWTLRRGNDAGPELIEAHQGALVAEPLDSYWDGSASRMWMLPPQMPVTVGPLPPLAQANGSHLRLTAYRFGPTDQPDENDTLIREAATGAHALGQLFASLLDDLAHTCYLDRDDLGGELMKAFSSGMADILSVEDSFAAQGASATQPMTGGC